MQILSRARERVAQAAAIAADMLIPSVCLSCKSPLATHDTLCAACWRNVSFIRPPLCDRLGLPMPYDTGGLMISGQAAADPPVFDRARAVGHFDGVLRDLIHQFKYADSPIARQLFGRWLRDAGGDLLRDSELIIPVPLHRWRLMSRRFNQAAVLAQELHTLTAIPWDPFTLTRVRRTSSQVQLTREQRRQNLQAAFIVPADRAGRIDGRNVLLVDDVITTGATTEACARTLKRAGAARVDVLALALVAPESQIAM